MSYPFILSANISMLFVEVPFLDRIEAAARAGFRAVECQFPYAFAAREVAARVAANGLVLNGINTPNGDPAKGEFGLAAVPGRQADFREAFARAFEYAQVVGAGTIHCTSGKPDAGEPAAARAAFLENFAFAADRARASGVTLLVEPLNSIDRPGYIVTRSDEIVALLRELNRDNVKLLFDIYHIQIMEGDLLRRIDRHWHDIGHVQIASVPDRQEPDLGEVAFVRVLDELATRGWNKFVGAEYNPRAGTLEGLGWAQPWLAA